MASAQPVPKSRTDELAPWSEADRLAALERYGILDTAREEAFDDIALLAAELLDAPMAVINFLAVDRQWFKAEVGIGQDTLPLDVSICRHILLQPGVTVVPDLAGDSRFASNTLVTADAGLRFYAGALLETRDGLPIGTICVLDRTPRPAGLSPREERALRALARQTMAQLDARLAERIASEERARAERAGWRLQLLADTSATLLAATEPASIVHELFARVAGPFELDVSFHYRCAEGDLRLVGAAGLPPELEAAAARIEFGQAVCGIVAASRAPLHLTGIQQSDDEHSEFLKRLGIDSYASTPLIVDGELFGTLSFGRRGRPFSSGELETLRGISSQVATALARLRDAEALRDSEGRFRAAVDAVHGILWTNDAQGRMTGEQPGWSALTGQAHEEYDGFGWAKAVHPEDAQPTIKAWNAAVEEKRPFLFEHRVRRADGAWRRFSVRAIPLIGEDGAVREWVGVHTDVTGEREAQVALAASEERMRYGLDAARMMAWEWDIATNVASRSGNGRELLGLDTGSVQDFFRLIYPEDVTRFSKARDAALAGSADFELEFRVQAPDGRLIWVVDRARVIRDDGGTPVRMAGVVMDITARKAAELALAERSRELERVMLAAPAAIYINDRRARRSIFTNEGVHRILGYSAEDIAAFPSGTLLGLVHPEDLPVAIGAIARVERASEGEVIEAEYRMRRKDGAWVWLGDRMTVLDRDAGGVHRTLGVSIDVSDRRRAEDSLRELAATLESRVARATAEREAAQAQVFELQKLETIGQLSSGIAHDFNNLLTPIVAGLDLLHRRFGEDARAKRVIEGAQQSAERARILVSRLLTFGRRQHLEPRPVDIAQLVSGMSEMIDRSLGPRIEVVLDIEQDVPPARIDANQLELALLNLCVNARDAMPSGGRLTIAADETDNSEAGLPPGRYVRLCVIDTGEGMDATTLRRAIEPFYSTKGVGKGTGLGLSMVHGLAAQSGGALMLKSAPGEGTTATIWLPVSVEPAIPLTSAEADIAPERRLSVLLVDDEDLVRRSVADMLTSLGHRVDMASDAEAALDLLRSGTPADVLLTDYAMPGASGAELARAARALRPGLPVVLVTGFADASIDGAADLPRLPKPFTGAQLARILDGAVRH